MPQPVTEQVLVIDADARVRAALVALIDATPGLQVAAAIGSTADAVAIGRGVGATVVVVGDVGVAPPRASSVAGPMAMWLRFVSWPST